MLHDDVHRAELAVIHIVLAATVQHRVEVHDDDNGQQPQVDRQALQTAELDTAQVEEKFGKLPPAKDGFRVGYAQLVLTFTGLQRLVVLPLGA